MKKIINLFSLVIFFFGCNSDVSVDVTHNNISKIFNKNCEKVLAYEQAFCQENIDYEIFYSDNAIIKGTILADKDSMFVADRKYAHKELWKKYDFEMSPLDPLPVVNPVTKKMDGSVRMYFDITITSSKNLLLYQCTIHLTLMMMEKYAIFNTTETLQLHSFL